MTTGPDICRFCKQDFSESLPLCEDCGKPLCGECRPKHRFDHVPEMFRPTIVIRYRDDAEPQQFRWRLLAANNEIIAASHRGWDTPDEAEQNVRALTNELVAPLNVGVLRDSAGEWRWHADDDQGDTVGKSSEGFSSRQGAERNRDLVTERLSHGFTIQDEGSFDLDAHKVQVGASMDKLRRGES